MVLLVGCASELDLRDVLEPTRPCDPTAPNTICTIVGNGEEDLGDDGVLATESPLYMPIDIEVAPDGELWVIDFNNFVVRAVDAHGRIHTVVGNGELGDSIPDGVDTVPAIDAPMNHVANLMFDAGYAYVAAWHNGRVHRVDLATQQLELFAGRGVRTEYGGDNGPATAAAFDLPAALVVSPEGTIVITDQANQVIREVQADGSVRTIAGTCIASASYQSTCEPSDALLACPDSDKRVCGDLADCSGICVPGFGGDNGPAREARFNFGYGAGLPPYGRLAYDKAGNLLVADTLNHRIRKIDRAGIVTTIAGTGVIGAEGDGGPATAAQLNHPVDLAVAGDGSIFFSDVHNHCIRRIAPDGTIHRAVGACAATSRGAFFGDGGDPLDAQLDWPYGIALDGDVLYIADSRNSRVRRVNLE